MTKTRPYTTSHWTFQESDGHEVAQGAALGPDEYFQGCYDVCAIEIDADAKLVDHRQIDSAVKAISDARARAGGATVMLFVHGWNNNADWNCGNFESFRGLVLSMAKREYERGSRARRVVGIYVGWEGGADEGLGSAIAKMFKLNYWNRDARARSVAEGDASRAAIEAIVTATKDPTNGEPDNSPLIMAGHSMGGLILETAMLHWVTASMSASPGWPAVNPSSAPVNFMINDMAVAGPDIVLLINPASGADDTQRLIDALHDGAWRKQLADDTLAHEPPLVISVTSDGDRAMGWGFPFLNALSDWPKSAGFTKDMHTHTLEHRGSTTVAPAGDVDLGQFWHDVRFDAATSHNPSPTVTISLPDDPDDRASHTKYQLVPYHPMVGSPMWIFRVPDELIDEHNDIFNFKAASLFLALAQAAGAVASLNYSWAELFRE